MSKKPHEEGSEGLEGPGEGRGVSGKKPTRRERRCSDGEGGHDSVPLLKSARLVGVLLCYGAALDGDPREINDPHRGSTRGSRMKREGTWTGEGEGGREGIAGAIQRQVPPRRGLLRASRRSDGSRSLENNAWRTRCFRPIIYSGRNNDETCAYANPLENGIEDASMYAYAICIRLRRN